jgi:hypothetical protein
VLLAAHRAWILTLISGREERLGLQHPSQNFVKPLLRCSFTTHATPYQVIRDA